MSLHTFLGVIGYGLIGLFVIGVAVYLLNIPRMRKRQQEFNEAHGRFVKQRADVDQFIKTGKKII